MIALRLSRGAFLFARLLPCLPDAEGDMALGLSECRALPLLLVSPHLDVPG